MKRDDFLNKIGFPADLEAEAGRLEAEAQALWETIRDYYFTKAGKPRKQQPERWSEKGQSYNKVNDIREKARVLQRTAARLQRVHNDPWSHVRSEELREYGFEAEALVVDAARERMEQHNNNARFIAEAENVGGHWVYQEKIVPVGRGNLHEGEHSVIVIMPDPQCQDGDGFMGLGIDPDRDEAERKAAEQARAVRDRRTSAA